MFKEDLITKLNAATEENLPVHVDWHTFADSDFNFDSVESITVETIESKEDPHGPVLNSYEAIVLRGNG